MIDLAALSDAPRLLLEADLEPLQTRRFQPTGFPDLGAAVYRAPNGSNGTDMLLVESAQSMANRCEAVCWDESTNDLVAPLQGLPYVRVEILDGQRVVATTSSLLEAHRLNSPYILEGKAEDGHVFSDTLREVAQFKPGNPVDRAAFVNALLRLDPGSLLHGIFMSQFEDGRLRLSRSMSSFIEATDVEPAQSGGVKNDRINPSGNTAEGFGNVPFARTEYTAARIAAYLNLDLRQIESFGLPDEARRMLVLLALFKFQKVLRDGLRLRTACDLGVVGPIRVKPEGFTLPDLDAVKRELTQAVGACKPLFADPAVTRLRFQHTEASSKVSKKKAAQAAKAPKEA